MPSGLAAMARELLNTYNIEDDELQRAPLTATGFVGVIKVGDKYQARLQVRGDGRGGTKKRKQHSLPGLFDTAKDAAISRAAVMKSMIQERGEVYEPPKLNKAHKPRTLKQPKQRAAAPQPLEPQQQPMPSAMAMPLAMPMWHVPFAALSPLPMQPIGYTPPRFDVA